MSEPKWKILVGDCRERLRELPDESVNMVWTSPPYFNMRDYGDEKQIGTERTLQAFISELVSLFSEVRRVLSDDGVFWLNIGDNYSGSSFLNGVDLGEGVKHRELVGVPWRVAYALQADGWYLRSDIIWAKGVSGQVDTAEQVKTALVNEGLSPAAIDRVLARLDPYRGSCLPDPATDRPSKSHEYVFLFSKNERYFYDAQAIAEPYSPNTSASIKRSDAFGKQGVVGNHTSGGSDVIYQKPEGRNRRTVWTLSAPSYRKAHFATAPEALIEPCIKAGCPEGGTVLDPFAGAGTTLLVAEKLGRHSIGIELNPEYAEIAENRLLEYHRDVTAPWEEGYIPEEEPEVLRELSFDDLLG